MCYEVNSLKQPVHILHLEENDKDAELIRKGESMSTSVPRSLCVDDITMNLSILEIESVIKHDLRSGKFSN
jgi:hypothetical protein